MTQLTEVIWQALQSAGLAPAGGIPADEGSSRSADWMPLLCSMWRERLQSPGPHRHSTRLRRTYEWLESWQGRGARLTVACPGAVEQRTARWIGRRLIFWPDGIPRGRRIGLISSRIGRALEHKRAWFRVLRAACERLDPAQDLLVTSADTTTFRFLRHCSGLFGVRVLQLDVSDTGSLRRWAERISQLKPQSVDACSTRASLSPPIETASVPRPMAETPARDRAILAICDRIVVLHLRRGGNLDRLIRQRLDDPAWPKASVFLAPGPGLVSRSLATELQDHGAVGWILLTDEGESHEATSLAAVGNQSQRLTQLARAPAPIVAVPKPTVWTCLTHCTRRQRGPWPDQREIDYMRELLYDFPTADRSALAALIHILQQQCLFASAEGIRGGHEVVSLTAVPLAQIPGLRTFRPHRARWDFEPYGICIERDWLEARGARPVIYGDESVWRTMPETHRPFFQKRFGVTDEDRETVDWSTEREWRHPGNLDLTELPAEAGLVFVPSERDARQLATVSPWPITVVSPE